MQVEAIDSKISGVGSVQVLPVNLFGSVMGISGLSLAWRQARSLFGTSVVIPDAIGLLAVVVFLVLGFSYMAKVMLYPDKVAAEFKHPVLGSFFGTITIAMLLVSSVIAPYSKGWSQTIWIVGTAATLVLGGYFVARLLRGNAQFQHVVPAWLIPNVAALDIAVAGGQMPFPWAHEVNLLSLAVGGILALVLFTLIVSRLIHHDPLPTPMVPSLLILIAPFEVGFLGYTNFMQRIDPFASALFYFGLFLFIVLFFKVFRKSVTFGATWWAVSFPMAALSNAALQYALFVDSWPLKGLAAIILALLTVVIVILFIRTLVILFNGVLLKAG